MFAYVRAGLSILAIFLVIVAIIHAKKNLQILLGSRDFIGERYVNRLVMEDAVPARVPMAQQHRGVSCSPWFHELPLLFLCGTLRDFNLSDSKRRRQDQERSAAWCGLSNAVRR